MLNIYKVQNFLDKARIIGLGNNVVINQANAHWASNTVCYAVGAIFGIVPVCIFSVIIATIGVFAMSKFDKDTTNELVDYLSENEK